MANGIVPVCVVSVILLVSYRKRKTKTFEKKLEPLYVASTSSTIM